MARIEVEVSGHVVGSIFKRGEVFWLDLRANGLRKWISLKTKIQKEAIARAEMAAKDVPFSTQPPTTIERKSSLSLKQVFEKYKLYYIGRGRRASSQRRAFDTLNHFIKFIGETKPAGYVERIHVIDYRDSRKKAVGVTTDRPLSHWTINADLARLRHFLRYAAREGFRHAAPDFTELRFATEDKKARGLSRAEIKTVREHLKGQEFLLDWFEAAINTGLRPNEQAHLRACDYDESERVLHVRPWGDWKPKTKRGRRTVPVNRAACEILSRRKAEVLAEQGRRKLAKEPEGDGLLFPTSTGTLSLLTSLLHRFQKMLPKGTYFTLYSLRHTYGYREGAAGELKPYQLMLRMGHSDMKTTAGYFEGLDLKELGEATEFEPMREAAEG